MTKRGYLGEFEHLVLLAVMRLGPESYGVTIRQEIETRSGRDVSLGAIYPTLERLEAKGYVSSYVGEPTGERGGRSKRHFVLQPEGEKALRRSWEILSALWEGYAPEPQGGRE
ncbi:MAG: helix-turn-helix transcriptional regulator [Gemmatimonadota bacterium]|nr:MAG: helix-turn-helix transcriptional regulator [Gemmatimonadota bacterium]